MAEFCLQCLKKFEPNANKHNTTVSINPYFCEGCGELKPVVVTFDDGGNQILKQLKLILIYTDKYHVDSDEYRVDLYHNGELVSSEEYINNSELDELLEKYEEEGYEKCYTYEEVSRAKQAYVTCSKYVIGGPKKWKLEEDGKAHCPYCNAAGMAYKWRFCPECGACVDGGNLSE